MKKDLPNSLFLRNKPSYPLENKKRYSLKKVATVTGIFCVSVLVLGLIIGRFIPNEQGELSQPFTLHRMLSHLTGFFFLTGFYYIILNKYYALVAARKPFSTYIPFTVLILITYGIYYHVTLYVFPGKETMKLSIGVIVISTLLGSCFMAGLGLLIAYLTSLRDEQKQHKILEKQKMELEIENSQANFNFLKAQINPHFLHNTLNFFYAKALPLSSELSEGILCLSDIMRYALNEGGKDEKALLKDEIEHLENVIRINQFRFNNNLNVQFEVTGVTAGAMIVPFVLITLVENAFKHGDLKNREHPIVIKINVEGKRLSFYCCNKKNPGFKEISTGIGLQNILKRLDIMYGSHYSYTVTEDTDFYSTGLIINPL